MLRLKDRKTIPNGGFGPYLQPESGRVFGGMYSISYLSLEIADHRKKNHFARATPEEAAFDLESATLVVHPELGYDATVRQDAPFFPQRKVGGCGSCGGRPR